MASGPDREPASPLGEASMEWNIRRPRARLIAGAFVASAISLASAASTSAQPLSPIGAAQLAVPTVLVELRDVPTAPGKPPTMGVTLEQSRAAFSVLTAPSAALTVKAAPGQATAAQPGITAVFLSPVGALSVIGTSGD